MDERLAGRRFIRRLEFERFAARDQCFDFWRALALCEGERSNEDSQYKGDGCCFHSVDPFVPILL